MGPFAKKIFLDSLKNLIDDIKKVIFSNISNNKLPKSANFDQIQLDIQTLIDPLIETFKVQLKKCYSSLGNQNAINSLLANFIEELNIIVSELFVSYRLEFDSLAN